jgi:hypothetical protein
MKNKLIFTLMALSSILILTALVSPSIFSSFSQAKTILVSVDGQLKNQDAVYKEFVQGREFWVLQLRLVEERIAKPQTIKSIIIKLKNQHENYKEFSDKVDKQLESNEAMKSISQRPSYKMNKEVERLKSESEFLESVEYLEADIKKIESELEDLKKLKNYISLKLEQK